MDIPLYLDRIQYYGSLEPNSTTLRRLQVAHLQTVPFENLDILFGRPLSLELGALFDKIVVRCRGGFCNELNGLFASLLKELGFAVTFLSIRDLHADGTYSPDFDHLTLMVECADEPSVRWLADVGPRRKVHGRGGFGLRHRWFLPPDVGRVNSQTRPYAHRAISRPAVNHLAGHAITHWRGGFGLRQTSGVVKDGGSDAQRKHTGSAFRRRIVIQ